MKKITRADVEKKTLAAYGKSSIKANLGDMKMFTQRVLERVIAESRETLDNSDRLVFDDVVASCEALPYHSWQGVVLRVFKTGYEGSFVSVALARCLWQVVSLNRKVSSHASEELHAQAISRYLEIDQKIENECFETTPTIRLAKVITDDLLQDMWVFGGSFGPGATFEIPRRDASFLKKADKLTKMGGILGDLGIPRFITEDDNLSNSSTFISRLVTVDKDITKSRTINIEPTDAIFRQKAIGSAIRESLMKCKEFHGSLVDQMVNQEKARIGSITRGFATIDLSDASDRLSMAVVKAVLPDLWPWLEATRSSSVRVTKPGETPYDVEIRKAASMGNGWCFEVQTVVYWALCVAAIAIDSRIEWRLAAPSVLVFGDDIIVPTTDCGVVCDTLESVGLLVNHDKSFTGMTPFRESCGGHFYDGCNVTPSYLRVCPEQEYTALSKLLDDFEKLAACANALVTNGFPQSAEFVFGFLEDTLGRLPLSGNSSTNLPLTRRNRDEFIICPDPLVGYYAHGDGHEGLYTHWWTVRPCGRRPVSAALWSSVAYYCNNSISSSDRGLEHRSMWVVKPIRCS